MVLILILMVVGVSGCGIKGAPVPPVYAKPPVVSDLNYQMDGNQLNLTWSVPAVQATGSHAIAGAKVFRLKQSLKNPPCTDCPRTFTLLRKIPARSGTMQFQDTIDEAFDYYYKIVLYDTENQDGQASHIVHVRIK
jgi:hypothetical protein